MNINDFTHTLTPESLNQLNQELLALLESENEQRFQQLSDLIEQRDALIRAHLASLDDETRKAFARNELTVNKAIIKLAQNLLDSAKNEVAQFLRSRAAIKKYK